jgi:hypothetical protein
VGKILTSKTRNDLNFRNNVSCVHKRSLVVDTFFQNPSLYLLTHFPKSIAISFNFWDIPEKSENISVDLISFFMLIGRRLLFH